MEKFQSPPATLKEIKEKYFGDSFFEVLDNDTVRFLDPVFKEPMEPFRPPRCIDEDPRLREGLKFLRELGASNRLTVQLVLAPHADEQNFIDIADQYGDLLKAAPAVGIEANWEGPENSNLTQAKILKCDDEGRRKFQDAQSNFLNENEKIIIPCDLIVDPNDVVVQVLNDAWGNVSRAKDNKNVHSMTRNRARNLAMTYHQMLRMWAIVAEYGLWLKAPELAHLWKPARAEPVEIPLILGTWHATTALRLLDQLKVNCEFNVVQHHEEISEEEYEAYWSYALAYMDISFSAGATCQQLDMLVPFD